MKIHFVNFVDTLFNQQIYAYIMLYNIAYTISLIFTKVYICLI
jgi:hypothetical protein